MIAEQSLQFVTVQQADEIKFNVPNEQPMQTLGDAVEHLLHLLTLDEQHAWESTLRKRGELQDKQIEGEVAEHLLQLGTIKRQQANPSELTW